MESTFRKSSVFTGNMFGLLGVNLATYFLTGITFGLAYPWLLCWKEAWYKEHTYINGRQLHFDGKGMQLIGNWIKWILLSLVTFGIYALWVPIKIEQWTVKHTSFADEFVVSTPDEPDNDALTEWLTRAAAVVIDAVKRLWDKITSWYHQHFGNRAIEDDQQEPCYGNNYIEEKNDAAYCPRCHTKLPANARFCGNCAYPVNRNSTDN